MKTNAVLLLLLAIAFSCCLAGAEESDNTPPSRHMTLRKAFSWRLSIIATSALAATRSRRNSTRRGPRRAHIFLHTKRHQVSGI
jgi:hypothetical protein